MKVLILDNYDSFTYNLYQYIGELLVGSAFRLDVKRNNEISSEEIKMKRYERIVISPGPGSPEDKDYFGVCGEVIKNPPKSTKILGVCLGMQGIAFVHGGKVVSAKKPMHGKTSKIKHDGQGVFQMLPQDLETMRYHSLSVERNSLPKTLKITATTQDQEIMGLRHKTLPLEGVQFHPESFVTEGGKKMLSNFLFGEKNE